MVWLAKAGVSSTREALLKRTFKRSAEHPEFHIREADGAYRSASGEELIEAALAEISARFAVGTPISSPRETHEFLRLQLAGLEHETFAALWMDSRNRVIAFEELFRGTIDGASVHPRELVKRALHHNAAGCILCHNHPSGVAEPSHADRKLTERVSQALALIDVRVLDHVIVAENACSFAELGLL